MMSNTSNHQKEWKLSALLRRHTGFSLSLWHEWFDTSMISPSRAAPCMGQSIDKHRYGKKMYGVVFGVSISVTVNI